MLNVIFYLINVYFVKSKSTRHEVLTSLFSVLSDTLTVVCRLRHWSDVETHAKRVNLALCLLYLKQIFLSQHL